MVQVPTRAPMRASSTPTPSQMRVQTTDLGLGAVADAFAKIAETKQRRADEEAAAAWGQVETGFNETFRPAAETYDGRTPGFAREQMAAFDAKAEEVAGGLQGDARRSFDRIRQKARVQAFQTAQNVEASAAGDRVRETRQRTQQLRLVSQLAQFSAGWAGEKHELVRGYTGEQAGFADQLLARFDARADEIRKAADPEDRELIELALANARADEWLKVQAFEQSTRAAWENETVRRTVETLTAAVTSEPGQYDAAREQALKATELLPGELGARLRPKVEEGLATALIQGMFARDEHAEALALLESGEWDERLGASKAQLYAVAQSRVQSEQDGLAAVTLTARLEAEIASVVETGVSTGFDPAEFGAISPAAVADARRKVEQAKIAYEATRGLEGLTPAQQVARVEALKPKPGDPDFATRQQAYELGLKRLDAARKLQSADPATATQADKANAALWRASVADMANPQAARAWATDTLQRQAAMGVPENLRRVLPNAEAKRVVQSVVDVPKDDAPHRAKALLGVYAYVDRYGANAGRVMRELQAQGLSASDAAVLAASDGDPVLVGRYTRALARQAQAKPDRAEDNRLREQLEREMGPLIASFAGLEGSAFADQLLRAAHTMGRAELLDGESPRDAARSAASAFTDRYLIVNGVRLPRQALRPATVAARPGATGADATAGALKADRRLYGEVSGDRAILEGARRTVADLVLTVDGGVARTTGAGLSAAGGGPLTDDQKRARLGDVVANRGRWVTTADDGGLMLVVPDPRGGVVPVLDKDGRKVVRTWAQLYERAGKP